MNEGVNAAYVLATIVSISNFLLNDLQVKFITDSKSLIGTIKISNVTKDLRSRVDVARKREMELLMISVILPFMLMISLPILSVIRHLIFCNI